MKITQYSICALTLDLKITNPLQQICTPKTELYKCFPFFAHLYKLWESSTLDKAYGINCASIKNILVNTFMLRTHW
jgi:hypothetical protein